MAIVEVSLTPPVKAVAIVHCHFERGGVTQVVQNHVACLLPNTSVVLVSGGRTSGLDSDLLGRVASIVVTELEYDSLQPDAAETPLEVRARATSMLLGDQLHANGLNPSDSVIHWHNHSLGKNAAAPLVIAFLADAGWRLLLQIHDFAEDQRPANYLYLIQNHETLDRVLYPSHPRISYAVLTVGDAEALIGHGIDSSRVHVIPNSVSLPPSQRDRPAAMQKISRAFGVDPNSKWLLYPVRGIRRKNVGEFLLWCQLLHRRNPGEYVGSLTLRPTTPVETASYDRWKQVASRWVPNLVFDTGQHPDVSFTDNLAACHCVLSASVAEGFGMAFLEPWLVNRRVVARDLPAVTAGFADEGLRLDDLYQAVWIPGDRDWVRQMNERWQRSLEQAWSLIPKPMRPDLGGLQPQESIDDRIDFARLTTDDQIGVLQRIAIDTGFADAIVSANERIIRAIESPGDESSIAHNRTIVENRYHADVQVEQLQAAYGELMSHRVVVNPDVETEDRLRMIDLVNHSHPFYPCRVEEL